MLHVPFLAEFFLQIRNRGTSNVLQGGGGSAVTFLLGPFHKSRTVLSNDITALH